MVSEAEKSGTALPPRDRKKAQPPGMATTAARAASKKQTLSRRQDSLEQRVAERTAELAAAEQRYRALVEQSLAGVYVIQSGHIVYANPMMSAIFGYAADEMIGIPTIQLVAPEDRVMVTDNVRRRLAGEIRSMRYAFTGVRKDGQRIDVEVHGSAAYFDGKPAVIGVLLGGA